jgi:hypothetical protein
MLRITLLGSLIDLISCISFESFDGLWWNLRCICQFFLFLRLFYGIISVVKIVQHWMKNIKMVKREVQSWPALKYYSIIKPEGLTNISAKTGSLLEQINHLWYTLLVLMISQQVKYYCLGWNLDADASHLPTVLHILPVLSAVLEYN